LARTGPRHRPAALIPAETPKAMKDCQASSGQHATPALPPLCFNVVHLQEQDSSARACKPKTAAHRAKEASIRGRPPNPRTNLARVYHIISVARGKYWKLRRPKGSPAHRLRSATSDKYLP
jgi:hypothetical protein